MSNLTAWSGGALNSGLGFVAAFGASDMNSLASLSSVMSTVIFDNTTGLDQFLDLSFLGSFTAASNAVLTGSGMSFLMACVQQDGTTYGDGRLVAGTQAAVLPLNDPLGGFPLIAGTFTNAAGSIAGDFGYVPLRPRKFRLIASNYTGFTLAASGNQAWISTYRQNMNA